MPVVLAVPSLTRVLCMWLGRHPNLAHGMVNAIAVFTIARPCAIGVAALTFITVGEVLEQLQEVTT